MIMDLGHPMDGTGSLATKAAILFLFFLPEIPLLSFIIIIIIIIEFDPSWG